MSVTKVKPYLHLGCDVVSLEPLQGVYSHIMTNSK